MSKKFIRETLKDVVLIAIGSALYAAGFQIFFYRNDIITGGVTGVAMIINYLTQIPVGMLIVALNIPLFIIAWRHFGLKVLIGSGAAMTLSSMLVDFIATLPINLTSNYLLASIYGGLFMGVGMGLIYLTGATTGGVDIAAKLIRAKRQHINMGTIILIMDAVVITTFAIVFKKYEAAMYAIVGMFITAQALDTVLYGIYTSKVCYIVSDLSDTIKDRITSELDRGVTILHGEGAYTGDPKRVIFCVIKRHQIADVRRIIRETDPTAFMIVTAAKDVFGDGFSDITDDR
ncbi:MAG: YitT family protein [Ruminococcaceae bacterium]|nr:YitT family protein [Oscillospiraceae bacterium]